MKPLHVLAAAGVAGLGALLLWPTTGQASAIPAGAWPLRLRAAPFPDQPQPGAVLVIPPGYDPTRPLRVAVYFRGFNNCATNVVGSTPGPCRPGGPTHGTSQLAQQLAASRANTLLIVPELRYEAASSDPGLLARPGGFAALMDEILLEHLPAPLAPRRLADVEHLGLMSHSGGYQAVAAVVDARPAALRSVALLDSLYGSTSNFSRWLAAEAARLTPEGGRRFASIYTGGTPAANSRALAASQRAVGPVLRDDSAATLTPEAFAAHPVLFKRSVLAHDEVSRYYPERLWAAGW